ncbi:MAG: hypothetical protein JXC85_01095 [Candidatus Aenigmarchaeota archaeon]|nr:hypothetical protein [Candidatus Aenigmarchaeota archaeon]
MIEWFALLYESPYIFAAVIIALVIIMYVMIRLVLFVAKRRHPGKYISHIMWKMKAKREKGGMKTVEDVYAAIMESLRREGILSKKDKDGLRSRSKALASLPDGEKRKLLTSLFDLYESKEYGNRRISNEPKVVSDILDRYANL